MQLRYVITVILKGKMRIVQILLALFTTLTVLMLLFYDLQLSTERELNKEKIYLSGVNILKSKCNCSKAEVRVQFTNSSYKVTVHKNATKPTAAEYSIPSETFDHFHVTCDMYKTLSRGPNQKVVSFSLYGQDPYYNGQVRLNIQRIKEFYPEWTARIYHDDSINMSMVCDLECSESHVDFCDVSRLPGLDVGHILPMTWRFLLIGDWFVDVFVSRDMDSCVFEREVDAVKVWLSENTLFHVMRGMSLLVETPQKLMDNF